MEKAITLLFSTLLILSSCAQSPNSIKDYPKSLASYSDFKDLVIEVEDYRKKRLVCLDSFQKMAKEKKHEQIELQ